MEKQVKQLDIESGSDLVEDLLRKLGLIYLAIVFFRSRHDFSTHTNNPMQDSLDNNPAEENDTQSNDASPVYTNNENYCDINEANDPRNNSHIKDKLDTNGGEVRVTTEAHSNVVSPVRTENYNCMDNENEINEASHPKNDSHRKVILTRILVVTSFMFELLTIIFGQLSSPHKCRYALIAMVTSFIAMVVCIIEIVYRGREEKVTWRRRGNIWWFYDPSPSHNSFCCLSEIFGLISRILQFICTTIAYVFH